jgi:hsp70-interacting protein
LILFLIQFFLLKKKRRKWLEEALGTMSVNPIDELKKCINVVIQQQNESLERKIEAMETLRDWCEDLNFAIDFHKINGYALLSKMLNHSNAELRALTCDLIGTCAQNNPYCQETLLDANFLPLLIKKMHAKDESEQVKIKALFGISCIVRDNEKAQEKLLDGNSLDLIANALDQPIEKLQIKTCFFISSISNNPKLKSNLKIKFTFYFCFLFYKQK